jgi:AcrR family transcriptional regulator
VAGGRRETILEAALECFNERGFAAATVEEIRRRSGASIGSIYHHFGGKEGIAAELYVEGLRGYQEGFLRALEAGDGSEPGGGGAGAERAGAETGIRGLVSHHLSWRAS